MQWTNNAPVGLGLKGEQRDTLCRHWLTEENNCMSLFFTLVLSERIQKYNPYRGLLLLTLT